MSDAEWDEFAKLGQGRAKAEPASKKRAEPVKPAEQREKKRDSVDSWDWDAKPKTAPQKPPGDGVKLEAQSVKAAGFGDFDDILEGKKPSASKM
jgi:hypothetical protein